MSDTRISVSAVVGATPAKVFQIVSDPKMHIKIDGSGMLETSPEDGPLTNVGDSFVMNMDREALGDVPMGKYQVINSVTRIVPDALFEWSVATKDRGTIGHLYGWEISEEDGGTKVTNYCDWSAIPESYRNRFPIVPASMMQKSVDNLVALLNQQTS